MTAKVENRSQLHRILGIVAVLVVLLVVASVAYQLGVKHGESGVASTVKAGE